VRQVAARGRRGFYEGELARRLLAGSERLGGTLQAADLAEYRPEWVQPISTTYRGWTVYEIPPSGQGIAALMMLNLMEGFALGEWGRGSARTWHTMIEAKKLAYADLLRYVADPRFARVPAAGLLAKAYARERARLIDPRKAAATVLPGTPPEPGTETTYLCAVDEEGNMVSLIHSNYAAFGSGIVAEGTGFALQNRGGLFTLEAGHPNVLAGRKRPLHTIIPAMMSRNGVRIAFGIMGGWNQAQAHAQFVANVADHGLNLQAALEAPRFTKQTFPGVDVEVELRVPEGIRRELSELGHDVRVGPPWSQSVGGGQAVMRDAATGVNYGASDPRKDGAAVPEAVVRR
jgi:gamma-glutamyltranspeptidase/glutathione hydrolase